MDRSKNPDSPDTIAARWFPDMAPIGNSRSQIAAAQVAGRDVSRDVLMVSEDRRFTLSHEIGHEAGWLVRDHHARIEVAVSAVHEARRIVDDLVSMIEDVSQIADRDPHRVVLHQVTKGPTSGFLKAVVEFDDGLSSPLGLFAVLDRNQIGKLLAACGISSGVPVVMAADRA